jgi:hypothetical protein
MVASVLNLRVQPFRLLTKAEAANYCRRSPKRFLAECPVAAIKMANGDLLWDVREIDKWIDSLRTENGLDDTNDIIARLR